MSTLLIVWHSRTGGAKQMAEAAATAAGADGDTRVWMVEAEYATAEDLLEADGYLFVCPENLASMSGEMKAFFDRCYYPVLDRVAGRPYAAMVCAGSDGHGTIRQIERIATGWRLKPVADPLLVITGAQTPEAISAPKTLHELDLSRCAELGAAFGAGLAMGIY